jgi:hypothetical protein
MKAALRSAGTKDKKERKRGVQRAVLYWQVGGTRYAMQVSVYPTALTLFVHRVWPLLARQVRGCFIWFRKRGNLQGILTIGHLGLCREELDLYLVVHEVYHAIRRLSRLGQHTEEQCAEVAGALAAAIFSELLRNGVALVPSLDPSPAVRAVPVSSFADLKTR